MTVMLIADLLALSLRLEDIGGNSRFKLVVDRPTFVAIAKALAGLVQDDKKEPVVIEKIDEISRYEGLNLVFEVGDLAS